ncbi:NeuD/PglB/VioB family sugar acetyltransferase [Flavobacterium sp. GT3P67]|uniref:NeuD/PglB/VioB family sugar acetyltransferase n=1 Tax=Flavobacterium sp. GT3P67 TaxID=2541722 RepID=UPI001045CF97|nr:NeuD/PglB/VioB family sugar acetyltransferase [Flavobacterium sp. GT3P67]TDE51287.1 acetyltransferase [Flavobacterium sp. GT3P67]
MKKIAIYGTGGFSKEIKKLIQQINSISNEFELIGFFDDLKSKNEIIDGYPVLGGVEELNSFSAIDIVIAIGNPTLKKNIISNIKNKKINYPNIVHPTVNIDTAFVELGKGIVICSGVFVSVDVKIEDFVSINVNCTIGHDAKLGEYSSLMPAVSISGNVDVGKEVFIGVGSVTNNDILIHDNVTIGAGSVVLKSINYPCVAMGNPAREMIKK